MFCSQCGADSEEGAKFCGKCGAPMTEAAASGTRATEPARPAAAPPPPAAEGVRQSAPAASENKNPVLAALLSVIIPGVGQLYNNDMKKGLVMLIGAFVLGVVTLGLAWFAILVWSAIDAYQVASGKMAPWS